ncbi:hypothetical protein ACHAXH_004049 [Discostella pseudostelligera]
MDQSRASSLLPQHRHRHRLNLDADEAFDFDVDQHQNQQDFDADDNIDPKPTAVSTTAATADLYHAIMSDDTLPAPAAAAPAAAAPPSAAHSTNNHQSHHFLDDIIVGYAFGPKKMETMGIIMAEASKALSTVECSTTTTTTTSMVGKISSLMQQQHHQYSGNGRKEEEQLLLQLQQQQHQQQQQSLDEATTTTTSHFFSDDEEEDTRSWSSTRSSQQHLRVLGGGGSTTSGIGNHGGSVQLTFLTDENGAIHLVRTGSSGGGGSGVGGTGGCGGTTTMGDEGETTTGTSVATTMGTSTSSSASCSSSMLQSLSSCKDGMNEGISSRGSNDVDVVRRQHPIRVSFVPIDLETPLEEQHGGKFDVILHKLTEDILCMSKMLRDKDLHGAEEGEELDEHCTDVIMDDNDYEDPNLLESTYPSTTMMMSRRQARASVRIQRLRDYKQNIHPSCVLVDSPNNILAVMSRAEMAEVLSRCLAGVTTRGGIPVRTPRFLVVEEDEDRIMEGNMQDIDVDCSHTRTRPALADEIDNSGFEYPLIAKPLTAAGTKSSHHMGIVLARDGLQRLKTPCLLQEFANHGEKLFKVYVLGESVWVFSRESLPNLPMGEKCEVSSMEDVQSGEEEGGSGGQRRPASSQTRESYVEFERPAGSSCYVEFNSQRPYPKLSDFGIISNMTDVDKTLLSAKDRLERHGTPIRKRQRRDANSLESSHDDDDGPTTQQLDADSSIIHCDSDDLAQYVTNEELEPVTNAIRDAFGLKLFGFDVIVKHDLNYPVFGGGGGSEGREILVVDVNYFPGYKEVPNFPSLLAQYLTQKAVESRIRNFDGS